MSIDKTANFLDNLKLAAPCNVSWESMTGDERTRLCSLCNKNVYNISQMSKKEANEFLHLTDHKACVNFFQRSDGTIITDDCPRGLKILRDRYRKVASAVSSLLALMYSFLLSAASAEPINDINDNNNPSKQSAIPLGGKPVATPLTARKNGEPTVNPAPRGGALAPSPMGTSPVPHHAEPAVMSAYRRYIMNSLVEAMPKNVEFGDAAISLAVDKQGKVAELRFIKHSPKASTDKLILEAIEGMKLKPLRKDINLYGYTTVRTYFECRWAKR